MQQVFSYIFIFVSGIVCSIYLLFLIINGDARVVDIEFENILLRYSVIIALLNASIACILIPVLAFLKTIPTDYWNSGSRERAKTNLIIIFVMLPGIILINIWAFYVEQKIIYVLDLMIAFAFFSGMRSMFFK